ncbi:hypothetical protein P3T36_001817 [Kitasatospora sp. MAP12-15]|nr:hypothetical protein [Kitasatospora sp. MAP12-44]MDH6113299.1 hypothetical protein [Kitasatospora sp. MAP12-44]
MSNDHRLRNGRIPVALCIDTSDLTDADLLAPPSRLYADAAMGEA